LLLPFLVGTVALAICFFTVFIAAFFGRAVPSLPFEVIDGGSPIQPNDRIVGAILLGFAFRLVIGERLQEKRRVGAKTITQTAAL